MPETIKLTKTIVLKSRPLTKTKIKIIENTIEMYKDVLSIALNFGLKNKRKSHRKIREGIYEEIKITIQNYQLITSTLPLKMLPLE